MRLSRKADRLNDLKFAEAELVYLVANDLRHKHELDQFDVDLLVKLIKAKFARQRQLVENSDAWKFQ